ncbi:prepilin peptidase [Patescibacteria group bacterium]
MLGATVGSFLNVAILRYGTNMSVVNGRSRCMNCSNKLKWYELIPIFSFVAQVGKCRKCHSKISLQYPLVEIITGTLFLLIWNHELQITNYEFIFDIHNSLFIILNSFYLWFAVSVLTIIFVYDLRHYIIPDRMVWIFNGLAFLYIFFENCLPGQGELGFGNWKIIASQIVSGLAFAAFFALLWAVSRGRWMGLGDAKLALGLGWFLGPTGSIFAFLFSFWLGAIISIILMIFNRKKYTPKTMLPFAPFLILGSALAYIISPFIVTYFVL